MNLPCLHLRRGPRQVCSTTPRKTLERISDKTAASSGLDVQVHCVRVLAPFHHVQDIRPPASLGVLVEAAGRLRIPCVEEAAHGLLLAARTTAMELMAAPALFDPKRGHRVEEGVDGRRPAA